MVNMDEPPTEDSVDNFEIYFTDCTARAVSCDTGGTRSRIPLDLCTDALATGPLYVGHDTWSIAIALVDHCPIIEALCKGAGRYFG